MKSAAARILTGVVSALLLSVAALAADASWNAASGADLLLSIEVKDASALAVSSDGQLLAIGTHHGVEVRKASSGELLRVFSLPEPLSNDPYSWWGGNWAFEVAFVPGTSIVAAGYAASGYSNGCVRLWDATSGGAAKDRFGHAWVVWHAESVNSVAVSQDGQLLASCEHSPGQREIKISSVATGELIRTLAGHESVVNTLAFSPRGRLLASGSLDGSVRLWDADSGRCIQTLSGHTDGVNSVAFSPDGALVASGASDGTVRLWHAASGGAVRTLYGTSAAVTCVCFSPDGETVAAAKRGGRTVFWEVATGVPRGSMELWSTDVEFLPDGKTMASIGGDGVELWDVDPLLHPSRAPTAQFTWQALSASGAGIVVAPRTGDRLSFDASASSDPDGQIKSYEWDWESDGSYDANETSRTIEHTFATSGSHRVTLRVTDDQGVTGTVTQTININAVPSAHFTWQVPTSSSTRLVVEPRPGDLVMFDASGSSDPDGSIVVFAWDWETDGTFEAFSLPNPTFNDDPLSSAPDLHHYSTLFGLDDLFSRPAVPTPTAVHTFTSSGPHKVTLRVTDDKGATATVTQTISIGTKQPPQPAFSVAPTKPSILDAVKFTDASTDADGQITAWSWEFGDETTSAERSPTHTYTRKGAFTVKLTVTDNDGQTGTKTLQLTVVNLPPAASLTFKPQAAVPGQTVRFDASASKDRDGTITSYAWDFDGDGKADATGATATYSFTAAGDHAVTLTVTDSDGATAQSHETITVAASPSEPLRFDNLWAVVIGVGEYIDSHLGDLEGVPTDDAQAVHDFLIDKQGGGFSSDHVRLLTDKAATKSAIEQAWGWLLREAGENDLVLVYFSGHGGHGDDYNGDEPEGDTQDEYLLPYDTDVSDLYSTAVRDDTVGDWVKSLRSEHVVLIFDSCHSGGAARTVKAYEPPGVRASPGNTVFTDLMGGEGVLVMAACHATEYAQQDDALGHGVFTYYLLRGLGGADLAESPEADVDDDGRVTVEELKAYLGTEVPRYVRDVMGESSPQNPEIIGDEALGSVALSGYGVPLLGEVTALDGDRVIISLGTRHGVQPGDRFEVVGVYALPDGTTMRETRATIEVLFILGPDRSVCRIVEQSFPIEVHDVVAPAP